MFAVERRNGMAYAQTNGYFFGKGRSTITGIFKTCFQEKRNWMQKQLVGKFRQVRIEGTELLKRDKTL